MRGRDLVWRFGAPEYPVARPLEAGGKEGGRKQKPRREVVVEPWALAKWWPGGAVVVGAGVWPRIDLFWKIFLPTLLLCFLCILVIAPLSLLAFPGANMQLIAQAQCP